MMIELGVALDSAWGNSPEPAQRRKCWICVLDSEQDFVGRTVQAEKMT